MRASWHAWPTREGSSSACETSLLRDAGGNLHPGGQVCPAEHFLRQIMKFLASLTLRRRHRSPRHALASLDVGESRSTAGAEEDAAAGPSETVQRAESIIEQVVNGSSEWAKHAPQITYRLSDSSVRKVSHQVHQQGLVTDQALCLARGLPPGRRYTPSRISRLAHVWRRSWTRRAAGRPVAPPRSAYGASPDGRPEGGQLAGVVEELPIGVPGRGLEAGRRLYQRSGHSPKFTPPAAGSTSAPRSLASSTPSRTARRRACGRSSWSAAGPPGRASVPAGGCDLGRAGCLSGPPRRPALPPALELAGVGGGVVDALAD